MDLAIGTVIQVWLDAKTSAILAEVSWSDGSWTSVEVLPDSFVKEIWLDKIKNTSYYF